MNLAVCLCRLVKTKALTDALTVRRVSQGNTVTSVENNHSYFCRNIWSGSTKCRFVTLAGWLSTSEGSADKTFVNDAERCMFILCLGHLAVSPPPLLHTEVNQVLQSHDIEGFTVFNAASVSVIYQCVFVLGEGLAPARQEPNPHHQKAHFSSLRERSTASSAQMQYSLSNICRL